MVIIMKNKIQLFLIMCFLWIVAGTANAEIIESSMSINGHVVYIEGRANEEYANRDIALIITKDSTGEIIYLNQIRTDSDACYTYKFLTDIDLTEDGYTLKVFNGNKDISYGIISAMQRVTSITASVTFSADDGEALLEWADKYGASHGENFKLIMAYYDENDTLLRVQSQTYTVNGIKDKSAEIVLNPPSVNAKYIKAFVWANEMKPIITAVEHEIDSKDFGFKNIVTTFNGDAKNQRSFAWTAISSREDMVIRYARKNDTWESSYTEIKGSKESYSDKLYYKADLTGLESGTEYVYVIGDTVDDVWGEFAYFTTESDDEAEFSFIAVADPQGSKQSTYDLMEEVVNQAMEKCPDTKFMLSLGDMVELGYEEAYWDMYFDSIDKYCTDIPHMAIIGNHEARDDANTAYYDAGLQFRLHFNNDTSAAEIIRNNISATQLSDIYSKGLLENIEGSVYSFDYGDVHIAALNSGSDWGVQNSLKLLTAQAVWLESDLKESDARWKIVIIHQGLYPAKEERYFGLRDVLEKTLQDCGVDLVLQGHDHMVGRTYPMKDGAVVSEGTLVNKGEGIVYYIPGSAGDKRYADTNKPSYIATLLNTDASQPTYSVFDISNQKLSVETYQLDGIMVDSFEVVDRQ